MLIASSVNGFLFGFVSGQPLLILGPTGPFLVFEEMVYDVKFSRHSSDYRSVERDIFLSVLALPVFAGRFLDSSMLCQSLDDIFHNYSRGVRRKFYDSTRHAIYRGNFCFDHRFGLSLWTIQEASQSKFDRTVNQTKSTRILFLLWNRFFDWTRFVRNIVTVIHWTVRATVRRRSANFEIKAKHGGNFCVMIVREHHRLYRNWII